MMSEWSVEPHYSQHHPDEYDHLIVRFPWLKRFEPGNRWLSGRAYLIAKRAMDLFLVLVTAPFWVLAIVFIAILIKLEEPNGDIFFLQERTGKGGRRFKMYKFRTMVMNAEELKSELADLNELEWPDFKISDDPRVTKMGRFLRKTSLDELPQMINVLRGEMSLVGPRPTSFSAQTYSLWQTERLDVIPGITGLWQLLGRGETEFDQRLRMDIAYIERRSLRLDFVIILRTILAVIQQRGAK
jgi:lipopolysaccharide/colanic/teichoic acid biosynthesis glycosyltransferase